jgi:hypothetical protein
VKSCLIVILAITLTRHRNVSSTKAGRARDLAHWFLFCETDRGTAWLFLVRAVS